LFYSRLPPLVANCFSFVYCGLEKKVSSFFSFHSAACIQSFIFLQFHAIQYPYGLSTTVVRIAKNSFANEISCWNQLGDRKP